MARPIQAAPRGVDAARYRPPLGNGLVAIEQVLVVWVTLTQARRNTTGL